MRIESFAQFPIQTPHQNFITSVPHFERRASMITTKWGQLHVITQKQCRSLVTDKEVVDLVEKVLSDFSNGDAVNPTKLHLPFFPDYGGWNNAMPSWLKKEDIHGIKWAGLSEVNPEKYGLPQCSAVIILNDMETAFPVALMDGTTIMAMRTGAACHYGEVLLPHRLQGPDSYRRRRPGQHWSGDGSGRHARADGSESHGSASVPG